MSDDETTPATEQGESAESSPGRPVLRIVKGNPTPEEIAALVTVLSARAAGAAREEPPSRRSEWAGHDRRMRRPVHPSPGGWRASAFPR